MKLVPSVAFKTLGVLWTLTQDKLGISNRKSRNLFADSFYKELLIFENLGKDKLAEKMLFVPWRYIADWKCMLAASVVGFSVSF